MRASDQDESHRSSFMKRRPHVKWANQLIALSQCQLSVTEREPVEAHLENCAACSQAYLVYRGIDNLLRNTPPPELPPGLPPKLQQLKETLLAEDIEFAKRRATPAPKQRGPAAIRKQRPSKSSSEKAEKKRQAKGREKASNKKAAAPVGAGVENGGQS